VSTSSLIFRRQRVILQVGYWVLKPIAWFTRRIDWVVGVEEVALTVAHLAAALPRSHSVVHQPHAFYAVSYDTTIRRDGRLEMYRRLYGGPLTLAWLLNRARGFVYVGGAGFLESHHDEREFEFSFVRSRGRRIVCYFTGTDIRSPKQMAELARATGRDNIGTMLATIDPAFASDDFDEVRRRRSAVASEYADVIFTAAEDQRSYFTRPTQPFRYFLPDDQFVDSDEKYEEADRVLVVHAPSNPVLKGTPAVRAAIERLQAVRDDFDYLELTGVSNEQITAALTKAHVVLNQFYALMPGVLGIEALAHRCVLLTSADPTIETDLPPGAAEAWVVTGIGEIERNLAQVLDDRARMSEQARRGHDWAKAHASASASSAAVREVLDPLISRSIRDRDDQSQASTR